MTHLTISVRTISSLFRIARWIAGTRTPTTQDLYTPYILKSSGDGGISGVALIEVSTDGAMRDMMSKIALDAAARRGRSSITASKAMAWKMGSICSDV